MDNKSLGLDSLFRADEQEQVSRSRGKASTSVSDIDGILAQEGADHLKPVIQAIYGQESGGGANSRTSVDGARGGMQVIPATFQRFAKPGERIDNPDDNMRVGVRIIKSLADKFGNDPAKIATGYFSGEGNVNPGQGSAWKRDARDGNGKSVSGYVSDVVRRVGGQQAAQPELPDLSKAPTWAQVTQDPEYATLSPEDKKQAKAAYFDYWIAPHAGDETEAIRAQFFGQQDEPAQRERTWGEAIKDTGAQLAEGVNTLAGALPNLVAPESRAAQMFNENAEFWRSKQSEPLRAKMASADQAITKAGEDGFISQVVESASQYFSDPALAARFVTTNLPSMIPGVAAAKVAQAAMLARGASAAKAASAATTAAGGVNAALNAGGARGDAFDDLKRTLIAQGYSEQDAERMAIEGSRMPAAVGGVAGFVSGKLGLEKALVGGAGGGVRKGVGSALGELAGEQIEEVSPQVATNIQAGQYDNRPVLKDVGRTVVETAIGSGPGAIVAGGATAFSVTPDGRLEPDQDETPQTVRDADAIVRELAAQAGIPESTVLPTQAPAESAAQGAAPDQDILDFASVRAEQLRAKRDGSLETVIGPDGPVDQEVPGVGLTPAEAQELAALEQAQDNPSVLRQLYGFDQEQPQPAGQELPAPENQDVQDQTQAIGPGPTAADQSVQPGAEARGPVDQPGTGDQTAAASAIEQAGQPVGPAPDAQPAEQAQAAENVLAGDERRARPEAEAGVRQEAPVNVPIEERSDEELRDRLDYIASQAKRNGGWDSMLRAAKREVEGEIARRQEAKQPQPAPEQPTNPQPQQPEQQTNVTQAVEAQQAEAQGSEQQQAAAPTVAPGEDAGNGFKHGPKANERYRISSVSSVGGALLFEKRLPAGTVASFYVKKDGGLIDADGIDLARPESREQLWMPSSPESSAQAQAILDEMGRLDLSDPRRADAKRRLKSLVEEDATTKVAQGSEAPAVSAGAKLPATLAGAKPRYSFGANQYTLTFDSDIDKAAYITAGKEPSKRDADYLAFVAQQVGMTEAQVVEHGKAVRAAIKAMVKPMQGTEHDKNVRVPSLKAGAKGVEPVGEKPKTEKEAKERKAKSEQAAGGRSVVDTSRDQRIGTDINGNPVFLGTDGALNGVPYTMENGRIRTGVAMAEDPAFANASDAEVKATEKAANQSPKSDDFDAMFDDVLAEELAKDKAKTAKPKTEKEAKEQRAEADIERGKVGMKLASGQVVLTASGRKTTPFPKVDTSTERKASNTVKAVDRWLILNALDEAQLRGDRFNERQFQSVNILNASQSDKDSAEEYLFGQQPAVVPSILKPLAQPKTEKEARAQRTATESLTSAAKNTAAGLDAAIDGLGKLFGGSGRLSSGLTFDEETYAKAKPLFQQAIANLKDASSDLKEAMRTVVRMVLDKFGAEAAGAMKPYVVRFIEETAGQAQNTQQEARNDTDRDQGQGARDQGQGGNLQPGSAQADSQGVAGSASEDVGQPKGKRDGRGSGSGAASGDVGRGGSVREGGDAANRRPRTGREGMADDGAGERAGANRPESVAPTPESQRANYFISDPEALVGGTPKVRFARNKKAIEAFQSITSEGRDPTQDELDAMAGYIGWGSFGQELFQGTYDRPRPKDGWQAESDWLREHLGKDGWNSAQASIINAHYTDPITVGAMWDMVRQLGFTGGRVLEPSMGVGNFFGLMPRDLMAKSRLAGIEMEQTTGGMAQVLYPDANIQIKPYQDSKTADNFYDLVIGNWPFAKDGPADRRYMRLSPSLHDYFFLKALDQTRPGGLVVGITSAGTMDKKGTLTRAALAEKADLVAAYRLPSGAFEKYAGTAVVTDIIILKKRETPNPDARSSGWLQTAEVDTPSGETITVNEYFAKNPDKVLGRLNFGSGTTYGRPAMIVERPADLEQRLRAIPGTLPANTYQPVTTKSKTVQYVTNNTTDRQQAITVQGGKLFQVQGEYLAPLSDVTSYKLKDAKKTAEREAQLAALVKMRQSYGALIDAERDGADDAEAKRKALREQYQAFTKEYGRISESDGLAILKRVGDPFYPSLASLEMPDGSPSAILSRPTVRTKKKLEKPSVRDALVIARNENIDLDMARVATLAGVSEQDAAKDLIESGAVFQTPDGSYEVKDVYLSGNVRRKLREAEAAAQEGMDMERNIKALKEVMPADIPYFNIEAKLGATWVRPETYVEFVANLLGVSPSKDVQVKWAVNRWKVRFEDRNLNGRPEATTTWGHPGVRFDRLLTAAMGNVAVKITYKDEDGNLKTDEKASAEANEKAGKIRDEFANWLWSDPVRKIEMERNYNEVMNAIALPKFDGSFLSFDGMALQRGDSPFNLRKHQIDAIWRGLANGRSINAHEVGTGKTYTMGGLAVESRRYGLAKKPIIFAHNANSASVAREIGEMYPGAKLLYIDNLAPDRIAVTLRQIANDEWDAVVVPHSLIDRFTLKRETLIEISREQIEALEQEAIEAAQEDNIKLDVSDMDDEKKMKSVRSATAKQLVHARNAIIKKVDEMALKSSREDAISFEDMGIDMVIVDEAHEFKKPPIATRMRMRGLNTQTSSQSISLMFMTDYVKRLNAGRGVHVFTGTPITNTMTEIFNMMRYVMDDQMARDGLRDWDAWFNTFADSTSDVELTASGEYEPVTRLASFVNVAELRRMVGQYMDIVFADDMPEFKPRETSTGKTLNSKDLSESERDQLLNGRTESPIGRPYKKVVADVAEMTPDQASILAELQQRANTFKNASKKARRDMMLAGSPNSPVIVETDAANAGLDARLFDMSAADTPANKVNRAAARIVTHYKEHPLATQVVFVERGFTSESVSRKKDSATGKVLTTKKERFNLVQDLIEKLVAAGVPKNEIAVVDGGVSKEKRKLIADAMNRAEIRVVIGNTKTLGVGVNMQANLRAMHHLDAPWMPGDLEQRNGRGHRQGNKWNTVMEYRYLTERIDGRRWQVLAVKDRFIKAFLKAKDDVRVIEGDAVSMDEEGDIGSTLSEAAGDPRLLMMNKLRADVARIESKERMHAQGVFDATRKIKSLEQEIERKSTQRDAMSADNEAFRNAIKSGVSITVNGKQFDEAEAANEALARAVTRITEPRTQPYELGEAWGFKLYATWPSRYTDVSYYLDSGDVDYSMGKATVESARQTLYAIKDRVARADAEIADARQSIPRLQEAAKAPFARAADLEKKRKLLSDIEADIQANPVPAPAWLRNGAPINTEVFVNGKAVVVEGHRWTKNGYLVTVSEADKPVRDVDYQQVKDENGLPVYEARPFAEPVVAKPTKKEATPGPREFNDIASPLPDTIKVDGKDRPTRNSEGRQIHPTAEGVRNFWKWFGDSKIVDDEGRPLVVYHGSSSEGITEFDAKRSRDIGVHFSESDLSYRFGGNKYEAYLKINNPAEIGDVFSVDGSEIDSYRSGVAGEFDVALGLNGLQSDKLKDLGAKVEKSWSEDRDVVNVTKPAFKRFWKTVLSLTKEEGFDGFEYKNKYEGGGRSFVVLSPTQIKSATGNTGAFDEAAPSILNDFSTSPAATFQKTPEPVRANALTRLKGLERRLSEGKITEAEYRLGVQQLIGKLEQRNDTQTYRGMVAGRRRGADWIVAQLRRGVADGTVPRSEAEFAEWLLGQNPNIANDLGISISGKDGNGTAGNYNPLARIAKLFTSANLGNGTAVHEILHHTERMMPVEVQDGIMKAWQRAWDAAYKAGDDKLKAALNDMLAASLGDREAHSRTKDAFASGALQYDKHYQLFSPSEFWTVNATRILSGRFAAKDSWVKAAIQWFKEFVQRAKAVFGLRSDAPVLKALDNVMRGEGVFQPKALMMAERVSGFSESGAIVYNDIVRKSQERLDEIGFFGKAMHQQKRKGELMPEYGKVWKMAREMQATLSRAASRPANLAPGVLTKIDDVATAAKSLFAIKTNHKHKATAAAALFAGTTAGNSVLKGRIWTEAEFKQRFGNNEAAWKMYQQSRAAIDQSLMETASAEAYSVVYGLLGKDRQSIRASLIEDPSSAERTINNKLNRIITAVNAAIERAEAAGNEQQVASLKQTKEIVETAIDTVNALFGRATALTEAGYAPLMRFGPYVVKVRAINPDTGETILDADGDPVTLERNHFETEGEALFAKKMAEAKYAGRNDVVIESSKQTEEISQLYNGVSPETIALFGDILGQKKVAEKFIQYVLNERNAMKRRMDRKQIAGYSQDLPRVLAAFITSNARFAANKYHMREIREAAHYMKSGDSQTEAKKLIGKVLQNIDDNAGSTVSTLAFMQFIGGNVGSAAVQVMQPIMQTYGELAFKGGSKLAAKHMLSAFPYAAGLKQVTDPELRAALKRASEFGVVEAQEIYHLYSIGARNIASWMASKLAALPGAKNTLQHAGASAQIRLQAFGTLWGSMFAAGESYNRRISFIAAYNMAKEMGNTDPFAAAVDVVDNTQGIFDKINRPNFARSSGGRTLLIFQQFKINYLEQLGRYMKKGGPEGRRALLVMAAVMLLAAGEEGLPFALNIEDLIGGIARLAGYNINISKYKREQVEELLKAAMSIGFDDETAGKYAKQGRNIFLYGLSSLTPFDMTRLGMGRILPTQWMVARTPGDIARSLVEIVGPVGGLGQQMQNAFDKGADEGFLAGVSQLAPTAVVNAKKGIEMWQTGEYRNARGAKVGEVNKLESVGKGLGFQPQSIASKNRAIRAGLQDVTVQKDTQSMFVNQYARAVRDNDKKEQARIMQKIEEWNQKNPEVEVVLTRESVVNAIRSMNLDAEGRLLKSTPRRMRAGLAETLDDQ